MDCEDEGTAAVAESQVWCAGWVLVHLNKLKFAQDKNLSMLGNGRLHSIF